jgi:hypothetical protein
MARNCGTDEFPLGDELLPDRPDTALSLCRDETIAALIHRVEGRAGIVAHALNRLIENFQACQHLIRHLQAGMTHDIGEPEGLDPLTGRSTFPTELEKHMDHGEHSLDQRQHLSSLLGSAGREADLVNRPVNVIFANSPSIPAALAATKTIPIIFNSGDDPVRLGFVASLNRPGGNATGVAIFSNELAARRLELMRELVPHSKSIAVLINSDFGPGALRS